MSIVIDCPSGMRIRIRGLKGKEGRLLADKTAIRQGTALDQILVACTEEIVDQGPYDLPNEKLDWSKVLLGDRFYTLLQIRIASFGSDYAFRAQCKEQLCRERFDYQIDLERDLQVKRMSEEDQEILRTTGEFITTMPDGTDVRYKLATGMEERMAARHRGAERALVDMLAMRITEIGDRKNTNGGRAIRNYLDELEWRDLVKILNALDQHDVGVQTDIEIECPNCGGVQEVQLPFERGFFLPTEETGRRI